MIVIMGILTLVFLCSSILIFSAITISHYENKNLAKKKSIEGAKDHFHYLFDVYGETLRIYPKK